MNIAQYMAKMSSLGYPRPSIRLYLDEDGKCKGSASYLGTCGHGGMSGFHPVNWEHLIEHLFMHVTEGGKRHSTAKIGCINGPLTRRRK